MIAYKFLAAGSVGPFSGFRWPVPSHGGAGPWVTAPGYGGRHPHVPGGDRSLGIHACRLPDLPYWLDEELWTLELEDPVEEGPTQIVALRGRLLEQVAGWTPEARRDLGAAAAFRVRDRAADAFAAAGFVREAEALRALLDLGALRREAPAISAAAEGAPAAARRAAEHASDAAGDTLNGFTATSLYQAVSAAVVLGRETTTPAAAITAERRWQARWLSSRCGLSV